MVVGIDSLQRAICSFLETEVLYKTSEGKRLMVGALIMMAPKFVEKKYRDWNQYITMMELGTEDGQIDIDKAESAICELMGKYGNYHMDFMGTRITLDQNDIHKIAGLTRSL